MKVKEAIEENKEWFGDLFDTIIPWEDQFVAVDKLVWVRCGGLPVKLWNTECFKHIARVTRNSVEIVSHKSCTVDCAMPYTQLKEGPSMRWNMMRGGCRSRSLPAIRRELDGEEPSSTLS
ncbi:hypothetical protein ACSQ67_004105 [Phaseolus vulgaris]